MNIPGRAIEIFVEGGTDGFLFYQSGGVKQASPLFPKTKEGGDFQTNVSYYFYAEHPERAPEPRLTRVFFDTNGNQVSETVVEQRPGVGTETLDPITQRSPELADEVPSPVAVPSGFMVRVLTSVGYVLRPILPEAARAYMGFIFPSPQELEELRDLLEIPDQQEPVYVAPDEVELADLRDRLNIPAPVFVPPDETELTDLAKQLASIRRGQLPNIPLNAADLSFLAWQLAPYIGFEPLISRPDNYAPLVDEVTIRGIARQIGKLWGIDIDLQGQPFRLVLEQAEANELAAQLAPLYGFASYVAPTVEEQLNSLPDEAKAAILLSWFDVLTTDQAKLIQDKVGCCGDSDESDVTIAILGHYSPAPVNRAPVVVNPISDQNVTQAGDYTFSPPANQFSDPDGDPLTITVTKLNGDPLPTGFTYDSSTGSFLVASAFGGVVETRMTATDPDGLSVSDDFTLVVTRPADPVIESIRKKIQDGRWVLYIQTNPVGQPNTTSPGIYYRITTAGGGIYDNGYLPAAWDINYNAAGENEPSSNGDPTYDNTIYSAAERSAGYYGLIYAQTRAQGDSDNQHTVTLQLSMNADGSNAITVSFVVTDNMNETVATLYTRQV
jgi:hypothetical protein